MKERVLIAAAWPYANGSLHLGHVASLIGADILARYFRSKGSEVLYISGSDCHGTPIAVEAEKRGIRPEDIAEKYHQEFVKTFDQLNFSYDCYSKTTTNNHKEVVQDVFLKLYKDGYIYTKTENLPYCAKCNRFLPDRYIEGECPKCHYNEARGDQCDECGSLMDVDKLIDAKCKVCGQFPEWKDSEHFFLKLSSLSDKLKDYVNSASNNWRANAKKFTINLLEQGLHDRCITRDIEWGVPVPLGGYESKRIYVWFEAVCGYLSASKQWSKKIDKNNEWEKFWLEKDSLHYYVHGKDNIPFHTVIWPSILTAYGSYHLPDMIISSEYLTLEKRQLSTSRNWAVWIKDFLGEFDSDTLRYYLISNGPENSDADFSWHDFQIKINNELIANFGNLVYRTFSLVKNNFPNGIKTFKGNRSSLINQIGESYKIVGNMIEGGDFKKAIKQVIFLASESNKYLDKAAPWKTIKEDYKKAEQQLSEIVYVICCLNVLFSPFLPKTSEKIYKMFSFKEPLDISWKPPSMSDFKIDNLEPIYSKIDNDEIDEQISLLNNNLKTSIN